MPTLEHVVDLACSPAAAFALLTDLSQRPRHVAASTKLELVEGPSRLGPVGQWTWKIRRWGLSQRWVSTVVEWEDGRSFVEVQQQGPFPTWRHAVRVEANGDGSRVFDRIDFEPPTGLLGRLTSAEAILRDLEASLAARDRALRVP